MLRKTGALNGHAPEFCRFCDKLKASHPFLFLFLCTEAGLSFFLKQEMTDCYL
jgi:hypothetical protein